jgi:hypothetical protein
MDAVVFGSRAHSGSDKIRRWVRSERTLVVWVFDLRVSERAEISPIKEISRLRVTRKRSVEQCEHGSL